MQAKDFIQKLKNKGINFFSGVPDSLLNALCLSLMDEDGCQVKIGVNEGSSLALAAGHYMATGNIPCVFMQNSGLGNIVNPFSSLAHNKVYGVPMLFVVGWRGEPSVKDEPQHVFMGEVTLGLLDLLQIKHCIIDENTTLDELSKTLTKFQQVFVQGQSCAFVVKKGTFVGGGKSNVQNDYEIVRENAIQSIVSKTDSRDIIVSSTGKISRELFEVRERANQGHSADFLTVGSMGFASSIACQIAAELSAKKADGRVICIDGDGAALMHMGCMAAIGSSAQNNLVHIILDNELHESVGGVPTVSGKLDWLGLSKACGYKNACQISTKQQLDSLQLLGGGLVVIKVNKYSRSDLGRPTIPAKQNLANFMKFVQK